METLLKCHRPFNALVPAPLMCRLGTLFEVSELHLSIFRYLLF